MWFCSVPKSPLLDTAALRPEKIWGTPCSSSALPQLISFHVPGKSSVFKFQGKYPGLQGSNWESTNCQKVFLWRLGKILLPATFCLLFLSHKQTTKSDTFRNKRFYWIVKLHTKNKHPLTTENSCFFPKKTACIGHKTPYLTYLRISKSVVLPIFTKWFWFDPATFPLGPYLIRRNWIEFPAHLYGNFAHNPRGAFYQRHLTDSAESLFPPPPS